VRFTPESTRVAAPGAAPRPTLVLRGVNFETGRSALTPDSYAVLDAVAASRVANPDIRIEIAGYTDNSGRRYLNMRLSQARCPSTGVSRTKGRAARIPSRPSAQRDGLHRAEHHGGRPCAEPPGRAAQDAGAAAGGWR